MKKYAIGDLAALTGLTRRTIRFYVQRHLLPPPLGAGRGHYYTDEHLARARRIRALQTDGLDLTAIAARLATPDGSCADTWGGDAGPARLPGSPAAEPTPPGSAPTSPPPTAAAALWLRLEVRPGVELHLAGGLAAWPRARVQQALAALAATFAHLPAPDPTAPATATPGSPTDPDDIDA